MSDDKIFLPKRKSSIIKQLLSTLLEYQGIYGALGQDQPSKQLSSTTRGFRAPSHGLEIRLNRIHGLIDIRHSLILQHNG